MCGDLNGADAVRVRQNNFCACIFEKKVNSAEGKHSREKKGDNVEKQLS